MQKSIVWILLSFLSMNFLFGQSNDKRLTHENAPAVAKSNADSLKLKLGLNNNQYKKIDSLERKYLESRVALPEELKPAERTVAIQRLETAKDEMFQKILTQDQYKKYILYIEERKKQFANRQKQLRERNKNQ